MLCVASLHRAHLWVLFYPVVIVNLGCWWSLGLAVDIHADGGTAGGIREPHLSPAGFVTRKATKVWCGFFVSNGAVALFTLLYADLRLWTLMERDVFHILAMGNVNGG